MQGEKSGAVQNIDGGAQDNGGEGLTGHENWQSGLLSIIPDQIQTSLLKSPDPDLRPENRT